MNCVLLGSETGLNAYAFHQKIHCNDFFIRVYLAILPHRATRWCERGLTGLLVSHPNKMYTFKTDNIDRTLSHFTCKCRMFLSRNAHVFKRWRRSVLHCHRIRTTADLLPNLVSKETLDMSELLGRYTAWICSWLPAFQVYLSTPSSRFKQSDN